jgi:hypothetical protein
MWKFGALIYYPEGDYTIILIPCEAAHKDQLA